MPAQPSATPSATPTNGAVPPTAAPPAAPEAPPAAAPSNEQLQQEALDRVSGEAAPATPTPEPTSTTSDQNFARTASALRALEVQNGELSKQLEEATTRASVFDKLKDPATRYAAAAELGIDYEGYTHHVLKQSGIAAEDDERLDLAKLPQEVQDGLKELKELKGWKAEQTEQADKAEAARYHAADVALAVKLLDVGTYPIAGSLGAAEAMVERYNAAVKENPGVLATDVAAALEAEVAKTSETQITAIAQTDVGKAMLRRALGLDAAAPEPPPTGGNPPATSEPPAKPGDGSVGTPAPRLSNEMASQTGDAVDTRTLSPAALRDRSASKFFGRRDS